MQLTPSPGTKSAANRKALIIGNSEYLDNRLRYAGSDADLMAQTLAQVGFSITERKNLTASETKEALKDYAAQLSESDTALVYFSGLGFSKGGATWLAPIDIK